jgi:hypothetical protein
VPDEAGEQSIRDAGFRRKIGGLIGEFVKTRPTGRDRDGMKDLFHPGFRK